MSFLRKLIETRDDLAVAFVRLALGLVLFPHGMQKLLGWFGGSGWAGMMGFFTGRLGLPAWLAALAILAESIGSLLLIAGFLGRVGALGVAAVMAGAIALVNFQAGYFWTDGGYEFPLLLLALALLIVWRGSGALSVDRALWAAGPNPASEPVRSTTTRRTAR